MNKIENYTEHLRKKISAGGKITFLIINPTSKYWIVDKEKKPKNVTKTFRFSMLTSLYVAASVPEYVDVQIIDEDVEHIDFDHNADIIGISFMTYCAPRAYCIADKFRSEKGKTVIMGGYHPTFMPEEAIQHADSVCIGEAENNVPKMFNDFINGELKQFYKSTLIDLKDLPVINRKLINQNLYIVPDMIQVSRGCNNTCSFCSISAFFHNKFRKRPVDQAIEEMKGLGKNILFMDDHLNSDKEFLKELLTEMIPLKKRWISQVSIDFALDTGLLDLAVKSGCRGVFIGFESLSANNLMNINKNSNQVKDYKQAIKNIHSRKIPVFAGTILGLDDDKENVFEGMLSFLLKNNVDMLQITINTPFPGTPLYKKLDSENRIIDKDWSKYDFGHVVFKPMNMDAETLWNGYCWVMKEFYSWKNIIKRLLKQVLYLDFRIGLRYTFIINLAYRYRFKKKGVFERARLFKKK